MVGITISFLLQVELAWYTQWITPIPNLSELMNYKNPGDSVQMGMLVQAVDEVYHILEFLNELTYTCRNLDVLQYMIHMLERVHRAFFN